MHDLDLRAERSQRSCQYLRLFSEAVFSRGDLVGASSPLSEEFQREDWLTTAASSHDELFFFIAITANIAATAAASSASLLSLTALPL